MKDDIRNKNNGLKLCSSSCIENEVTCPVKECKFWMNYGEDHNCDLIAIHKNGNMTLREVADRLGVSFVRIKQIEQKAITKITKRFGVIKQ